MGRHRIILSSSLETFQLGKRLGASLKEGTTLALKGDLGAGKTTFVQGLAHGLNIHEPVLSPTYVYLNQYEGSFPLFHFDLYRLKRPEEFLALGFEEYFEKEAIAVIEWPEIIEELLPKNTLELHISHLENDQRELISRNPLFNLENI